MALTPLHVRTYCSSGNQCRYLDFVRDDSTTVAVCTKLSPSAYKDLSKKPSFAPREKMGDNCKGYTYFLSMKQGFDVDE